MDWDNWVRVMLVLHNVHVGHGVPPLFVPSLVAVGLIKPDDPELLSRLPKTEERIGGFRLTRAGHATLRALNAARNEVAKHWRGECADG